VIRAIAKVPTDLDERPRVAVKIVSCGQVDRKTANQGLATVQIGHQIAALEQEMQGEKVQEATKAKAILAGKPGGAKVEDGKSLRHGQEEEEVDESAATAPPRNERERKLFELRMRMNQGRTNNSKEVIEEQKRNSNPDYAKKKAEENHKRRLEKEEGVEKDDLEITKERKPGQLPEGKDYMNQTVEFAEMRDAKKKKGNPDAFGWDIFNQDSLLRAHEKRLKNIKHDDKEYAAQQARIDETDSTAGMWEGFGHTPSEDAKDRLQQAMDKSLDKSKAFSRRRMYVDEEDCNYVNERNRVFNKKLDRAFNAYTTETRQNLERGTNL